MKNNDGLSDRELSDYSELVKREVSELDGVERVDLYGKRPECINISLPVSYTHLGNGAELKTFKLQNDDEVDTKLFYEKTEVSTEGNLTDVEKGS